MRMRRNNSDVKSVAACFRGRNHPAEAVDSVCVCLFNLQEFNGVRIAKRAIVRFTDIGLDSNMSGLNRPEKNVSGYFEFIAYEQGSSSALRCLDGFNPNM